LRSSHWLCTGVLGWLGERREIARQKLWHRPKRQMKIRGRQSSVIGTREWSRLQNRRIRQNLLRCRAGELIPNLKRGIENWQSKTRRDRG
jgi:hypothetical protein